MSSVLKADDVNATAASGEFVDVAGERYYVIRNVDKMTPFFISVVSSFDHWLFVSSTGGLTAGRVSPETALFPYVTVDRIHESGLHTGPRTIIRVQTNTGWQNWEPFNPQHDGRYATSRHLYKNTLGNKLCFAEINHDLALEFRYTWKTSDEFGFVRDCELHNLDKQSRIIDLLDGLQNILPAGTPRFTQTNSSNLVDAYKWTEYDAQSGLALFSLYSGITDRAEPCESLKANVAYCIGLDDPAVLVSSGQLGRFRRGEEIHTETHKRGIRGAFLVNQQLDMPPESTRTWQIVADLELDQARVAALRQRLQEPDSLANSLRETVSQGSDELARIMAMSDGFQATAEENVSVHHYANVLFNNMRGGYFPHHYDVSARDFRQTVRHFNARVYARNETLLRELPENLPFSGLLSMVREADDPQLKRLCHEYLPITFGRRHGDPSRPWNQFAIRLKDRSGLPLYSYEGNWRDIFQNWEALALSYPEFVENMIAKFVNASTMDGYNPYRITKDGIDWEVEDPEDPWSYIGYWGDHQVIYLQKLLEISHHFHPARLGALLREPMFAYANVPYRIRSFEKLLADPKHTVDYDEDAAEAIEKMQAQLGADAKLVMGGDGEVLQVTLLEKLLVPLLSKLGNLVVDGGIWMNTQRPEWNDANNALVGQGLSVVTLCYLRRYVSFLKHMLANERDAIGLSGEIREWLTESAAALQEFRPVLDAGAVTPSKRMNLLRSLGEAASRYRDVVFARDTLSAAAPISIDAIRHMLDDVLAVVDHSVDSNRRDDGMFHAYNLLKLTPDGIEIGNLYPMLEGQVAALSTGAMKPAVAAEVVEALFDSAVYRADQKSFMLYPDRRLPGFLEKNRIPEEAIAQIPLLQALVDAGNTQIVLRDVDDHLRFSAEFTNVGDLEAELDTLPQEFDALIGPSRAPLHSLFERVFEHQAFTGRSGTMFGFEGLGCIYWHMVAKLLVAVQENYFAAANSDASQETLRRLGKLYYRVRGGIGFNKSPAEYGAFPTDPYSHTPSHNGARQPGMTGQVKEEILTRFGELGVRVTDGVVTIRPTLLRRREFVASPRPFCYLAIDGGWRDVEVPASGLAFTVCQVPFVYQLDESRAGSMLVDYEDGTEHVEPQLRLSDEDSASLFDRAGHIRQVTVFLSENQLFSD